MKTLKGQQRKERNRKISQKRNVHRPHQIKEIKSRRNGNNYIQYDMS